MKLVYRQLRARRALSLYNNVPLRSIRALSLYWFSMEHHWTVLTPFWLLAGYIFGRKNIYWQFIYILLIVCVLWNRGEICILIFSGHLYSMSTVWINHLDCYVLSEWEQIFHFVWILCSRYCIEILLLRVCHLFWIFKEIYSSRLICQHRTLLNLEYISSKDNWLLILIVIEPTPVVYICYETVFRFHMQYKLKHSLTIFHSVLFSIIIYRLINASAVLLKCNVYTIMHSTIQWQ